VDTTRSGKRFPDSLSKTIPIWCCVINRIVKKLHKEINLSSDFDANLHIWDFIGQGEKHAIEKKIDDFVDIAMVCFN